MNERRLLDRANLSQYLKVINSETDEELGRLADINICGFLLLNKQEMPTGDSYDVKIVLPKTIDDKEFVSCKAIAKRCSKGVNPSFYEIGFEISDIQPTERFVLEKAILQYEMTFKKQANN